MAQLGDQAGLLELAGGAQDLPHHLRGRRRISKMGWRIDWDQLDAALAQQRMAGELDDQVAGELGRALRQHDADGVGAEASCTGRQAARHHRSRRA